jgi:hypothetical protein
MDRRNLRFSCRSHRVYRGLRFPEIIPKATSSKRPSAVRDRSNALYGQIRKPFFVRKLDKSGEHSLNFFESPLRVQFCKLFGCLTRNRSLNSIFPTIEERSLLIQSQISKPGLVTKRFIGSVSGTFKCPGIIFSAHGKPLKQASGGSFKPETRKMPRPRKGKVQ